MGIRIQKHLGFGLDTLQLNDEGEFDDPRLTIQDLDEKIYKSKLNGLLKFLDTKSDEHTYLDVDGQQVRTDELAFLESRLRRAETASKYNTSDYVHLFWGGEDFQDKETDKGIILFQPYLNAEEWTHYDDAIDYSVAVESSQWGNNLSAQAQHLIVSPYPYNGSYTDYVTGEPVNADYWKMAYSLEQSKVTQPVSGSQAEDLDKVIERIATQELGYNSYAEAAERVFPTVPAEIIAMAQWLNIFADEKTVRTLKPMIVTSWS